MRKKEIKTRNASDMKISWILSHKAHCWSRKRRNNQNRIIEIVINDITVNTSHIRDYYARNNLFAKAFRYIRAHQSNLSARMLKYIRHSLYFRGAHKYVKIVTYPAYK